MESIGFVFICALISSISLIFDSSLFTFDYYSSAMRPIMVCVMDSIVFATAVAYALPYFYYFLHYACLAIFPFARLFRFWPREPLMIKIIWVASYTFILCVYASLCLVSVTMATPREKLTLPESVVSL